MKCVRQEFGTYVEIYLFELERKLVFRNLSTPAHTGFSVNLHSMLPECQGTSCSKQARYLKVK